MAGDRFMLSLAGQVADELTGADKTGAPSRRNGASRARVRNQTGDGFIKRLGGDVRPQSGALALFIRIRLFHHARNPRDGTGRRRGCKSLRKERRSDINGAR